MCSFKLLRDCWLKVTDQIFSIVPKKERLEGGRTEIWRKGEKPKPLKSIQGEP